MSVLETLRHRLARWLGAALPTAPGAPRRYDQHFLTVDAEADRRSIRQVTLEQIGVTYWTCHTQF